RHLLIVAPDLDGLLGAVVDGQHPLVGLLDSEVHSLVRSFLLGCGCHSTPRRLGCQPPWSGPPRATGFSVPFRPSSPPRGPAEPPRNSPWCRRPGRAQRTSRHPPRQPRGVADRSFLALRIHV